MARLGLAVMLAVGCLGGCGDGGAASVGPAIRDSAGIRIVEHPAQDARGFELGPSPTLTLGLAGDDRLPLYEVSGGVLDATGGIIVADGGNHRLARWSSAGERLSDLGRQGEGPGEFEGIMWVQAVGAEVVLYDSRLRRITWYDPSGGFLRSRPFSLELPEAPTDDAIVAGGAALGLVGSGEVLAYAMAFGDPQQEAGPLPLQADLQIFDTTSTVLRSIGRYALLEWYEDPAIEGIPLANRMETPRVNWSARDELFALSAATAHRIDIVKAGRLQTIIYEDRARLPFEPDSIPAEYHLAADSLQAYRDVRVDAVRRIWVKPAVPEGEPTARWRVFTERGERLGDLQLPADASVLDATATTVLLLRRSELDEESVQLWDLRAPAL